MPLEFAKHEKISLRKHPDFSELWLHERICDDTAILGLGDLDVIERERPQLAGGRLDILLADSESSTRYEVEVMLGATDPSHIVRCIEYWDVERRRYPAYDHVAVLVAEEVTSRFLNVMSLLSGSIPLVAIQLNALKVGGHLVLDFVKVLDQRDLREDDTISSDESTADRQWWESRKGSESLGLCDRLLELSNEKTQSPMVLRYAKTTVSIGVQGAFFPWASIWPKKDFIPFRIGISDADDWVSRLAEVGIEAKTRRTGRLIVRLKTADFKEKEDVIRELVHQSVTEFEA
jgi:hypothetical protein